MTDLQIAFSKSKIIAAVNTYSGQIISSFPDYTYVEIDKCELQG